MKPDLTVKMKIIVICVFVMAVMAGYTLPVWANYPIHLADDSNYILIAGKEGIGWYLVRDSIVLLSANEEGEKLALKFDVCQVNNAYSGDTEITHTKTHEMHYIIQNKNFQMLVKRNDELYYLNPLGSWATVGTAMPAGELAFYIMTGDSFYGSCLWSDDILHDIRIYGELFYARANY